MFFKPIAASLVSMIKKPIQDSGGDELEEEISLTFKHHLFADHTIWNPIAIAAIEKTTVLICLAEN